MELIKVTTRTNLKQGLSEIITLPTVIKDRCEVENNCLYKQIVGYCIIRCKDEYLIYQRKNGEQRLDGLLSIGFGGHIEAEETITEGVIREVKEELGIDIKPKPIRLINDNTTHVGKCHVGYVFEAEVEETFKGIWATITHLKNNVDNFEMWSQILIKEYLNV